MSSLRNVCWNVVAILPLTVSALYGQKGNNWVDGTLIEFKNDAAWCWFQDERAVVDTSRGRLIIGSTNMQNSVDVTFFDITAGKVESSKQFSRLQGGPDDHNAPAVLIRPDGGYLAMWSYHFDEYNTHYSNFDGSKWSNEKTFDWTKIPGGTNHTIAYCNICYLSSEKRTYNFVRANNKAPNIMISDDNGTTWKFGGQLTTNGSDTYNKGYYKYWSNGVDRIDMVFTEQHPRDTTTSIFHGYIRNGKCYSTDGTVADDNILDTFDIPNYNSFTRVFKNGTELDGISYGRCWQSDIMRYSDSSIAILFEARADNSINDHRNFYARYDGVEWKYTYIGKAGSPMYSDEEDYTGLGALCPDDPSRIYISSPYNPGDDSSKPGKREIWRGSTSDKGKTWEWEAVTANSSEDNFRPIVPRWKPGKEVLLWFRGRYTTAQNFATRIVGTISEYTVKNNYQKEKKRNFTSAISVQSNRNGFVTLDLGLSPLRSIITVTILTVSGKPVVSFANGVYTADKRGIRFSTGNIPQGVYLCRVTTREYSKVMTFGVVR